MTINQIPAPIVNVVGLTPSPGQGETEAKPNAEPMTNSVSETPIAVAVPAQIADHETAELVGSIVVPVG